MRLSISEKGRPSPRRDYQWTRLGWSVENTGSSESMRWDGDWAGAGVVAPLFTAGDRVALTGKNWSNFAFRCVLVRRAYKCWTETSKLFTKTLAYFSRAQNQRCGIYHGLFGSHSLTFNLKHWGSADPLTPRLSRHWRLRRHRPDPPLTGHMPPGRYIPPLPWQLFFRLLPPPPPF